MRMSYYRLCRKKEWLQMSHGAIIGVLLVTAFYGYYYNVYEYMMTTPFAYFQYPLEVDMPAVVDQMLKTGKPKIAPINMLRYPYVLNAETQCKFDGEYEEVFILFVVKSTIDHFERRQMIRKTWAKENVVPGYVTKRVFLLGVSGDHDRTLQHRVGIESVQHGDIVQQYFVDSYYNNTVKLMMGFQWAISYCHSAKFLAFLDDDYYVSPHNLAKLLEKVPVTRMSDTVIGHIWKSAMPFRIKSNKWYISLKEYPYRYWPPYPTAGSFFLPMDTAQRLYIAMQYTKMLRFDDVFVGIAAWKLKLKLVDDHRHIAFHEITYSTEAYRDMIAVHGYDDTEKLYRVWHDQESHRRERDGYRI